MRYLIPSQNHPGIFDCYQILEYSINKLNKSISFKYEKIIIGENGIPQTQIINHSILDQIEIIIDPTWSSTSQPIAKPDGFDPVNPFTWGNLSWDDIPKCQNPDKLYATKLMETSGNGEQAIIEALVVLDMIPEGGSFEF